MFENRKIKSLEGTKMIDINEVGTRVYSSGDGITVYCNKEKETITVNRSEMGIAESYFVYSLKEKRNRVLFWDKREYKSTQFSDKRCDVKKFGTIGFVEKKTAKEFLIYKIIRDWKISGQYSFNVDSVELEAVLRKAFL